jgi:hypothetical protein
MRVLEEEIRNQVRCHDQEDEAQSNQGKTGEQNNAEKSFQDLNIDEHSDEEGSISKLSVDGERMRGYEKNIEKLLLSQIDASKVFEDEVKPTMDRSSSEMVKNKYDKRIYELDIYRSILQKIHGFDYRYPKNEDVENSKITDESTEGESD